MWLPASRSGVVLQAIIAVPIIFIITIISWGGIARFFESREDARSIRKLQPIVDRWLQDPHVHSLKLGRAPADPGRLLIRLDVDDKATCEAIVRDLKGVTSMRLLPLWEFTIRDGAKFEVDYGYGHAAEGMAGIGNFMSVLVNSAAISIFVSIVYMVVGFGLQAAKARLVK